MTKSMTTGFLAVLLCALSLSACSHAPYIEGKKSCRAIKPATAERLNTPTAAVGIKG